MMISIEIRASIEAFASYPTVSPLCVEAEGEACLP